MVCRELRRMSTVGRWLLALALAVIVLSPGLVFAQGGLIAYGSSVVGSITAEAPFVIYTFNGNPGDQITVYAVGMTDGMAPGVSLLGPNQRQLAVSEGDPFGSGDTGAARLSYRLMASGVHSLLVSNTSGTPGEFLLRLSGRPSTASTALMPGTPMIINVPPGALPTTYSFSLAPDGPVTLTVRTDSSGFAFLAQIYDGNGALVAGLAGSDVRAVALTVGPGSGIYEVSVRGLHPEMPGTVQLLVSLGEATAAGAAPGQPTAPPVVVTEEAVPSVCSATSGTNVNVRNGPSTDYAIIGALFPGASLPVIGRNNDSTWFVVDYNGRQGWVASSVVTLVGPCGSLPTIQPPPLPTPAPFTPTPPPPAQPVAQISFTVNGAASATIVLGECATIMWDVQNVSAVYYQGTGVSGYGTRSECPTTNTTYILRVVLQDGTETTRAVTINVVLPTLPPLFLTPLVPHPFPIPFSSPTPTP